MSLGPKPHITLLDFRDLPLQPGIGCLLASQLTERLKISPHYSIVNRYAWKTALDTEDTNQEYRFHAPWAAHVGALASADAVVIGKIHQPMVRCNVIILTAMLVETATGRTLATAEHTTLDEFANLLNSRRLAEKIRIQKRSIRAEVCCARGDTTILNIGRESGLLLNDHLRLERILEEVPDPYDPIGVKILDYLIAPFGEAKVVSVGRHVSVARSYDGGKARPGDFAILTET